MSLLDYTPILKRITPSQKEVKQMQEAISQITNTIKETASKQQYNIDVVPGGSTAKGTFLKGSSDIDIFVRFFKTQDNLSKALEEILKEARNKLHIQIERVHGSRDYFQTTYKDYHFEFVPVQFIKKVEQANNSTDLSPLHVFWVQKHSNEKLKNDIRLAKQFCKAAKVYGAESYIKGFSGHVIDILLIYYGSFEKFIQAASLWKPPVIIDSEKQHKDVFAELNDSKLQSPLIVIDPIDKQRNAAAALQEETFYRFIQQVQNFLKKPAHSYFEIAPFSIEDIKKKVPSGYNMHVIQAQPLEGNKDIAGTKILKIFEYIKKQLEIYGFKLYEAGWNFGSPSTLYFITEKKPLSKTFIRQGPPIEVKKHSEQFIAKHPQAYKEEGVWKATIKRKHTQADQLLAELCQEKFVCSRAQNVQLQKQ